ncbi:MAG TPA: DsrE/DsrF/DrsH-like family protein [Candidatus Polarisedimenticolia bacterium]|nr:DsrE/DsrF/DrsH-like family protein [Candidatus Polarisedimenticolia bacterium]
MIETPSSHASLESKLAELQARVSALEAAQKELAGEVAENRVSMVVFSGDLDKVLAAFVIASGAAAMGMEVSMFFTFWGLSALKKGRRLRGKKPFEQAFALMTPGATTSLGLSQMNFGGVGAKLMRKMMRDKQIASLEDLAATARELGVRTVACQMSMDVMGITTAELCDGLEVGGVATFLGDAARSKVSLFI